MDEARTIVIKVKEFECDKNIAVGEGRYVPCLKKNILWLNIDKFRGRILWGGETCEHYGKKVGTEVAWEEAIGICELTEKKQVREAKEAEDRLKKTRQVIRFLKKEKSKHTI